MIRLVIPGKLPGLNEYIYAERSHRQAGAKMRRETERRVEWAAKSQLRGIRFKGPVIMHYTWVEQNRRRDKDNIAFAKKFVQDALVHVGVLGNDGWDYVDGFTDNFAVDKNHPRVEVWIEETHKISDGWKRKDDDKMTDMERFAGICGEMTALYGRKNPDYGDSFHKSWEKFGMTISLIRLGDKLSRLVALTLGRETAQVADESARDTMIDMANYAIMSIMEMDQEKEEKRENHQSKL